MMTPGARAIFPIAIAAALFVSAAPAQTSTAASTPDSSPAGLWTGTAQVFDHPVPFRLEVSGSGDQVRGALLNGKDKYLSSDGSYSAGPGWDPCTGLGSPDGQTLASLLGNPQ